MKIIGIAPADPRWHVLYKMDDGTNFATPLAAWVLVEEPDGTTFVSRASVPLHVE